MGQTDSKHGGGGGGMQMHGAHTGPPLSDTEIRVILWEVSIARGCLETFNRTLAAHAIVLCLLVIVNLMGFLQPPRGWDRTSGHMFANSKPLLTFSLANSLSLYSATSGLLFSIYCCIFSIVSLQAVPLPSRFDDPLSLHLLHSLRASLRRVTLPSVRRRCAYLFSSLACSLTCCMVAYFSAGIASTTSHDHLIGVILPAIPGWVVLLFLLQIGATKLCLELDFDTRFSKLWSTMAPHIIHPPAIRPLDKATIQAIDPLPRFLLWFRNDR